ncbi:oxidoreductase [Clostridium thermosuccinogenes]|jgi:predicted dehydrogenase|uniref:Oxidoreductase n=1 Tax=Clostridium thermosuccinogenes TaxID=84032 RepID=A0A2K2FBA4_9CLOT|nr:Gfo/Idh/MocA family oxidoreductase [Pseudoclostridium thermosuccinogenes]AUS95002.1 oxidoreductase [Pseudoclostridium thermosuccinogenes]PNT91373.1 oxidoreductase [Pseudoclostridium thermosuccinogenes]PNT96047.1 oxidoreductase [Pseudoclostridium thermosuccinogenes]PNT97608.1 oxidoreductase [Pseudoclostridium thermosuccinogenes]
MSKVRIGIIGIGNMGSSHALYLSKGEVPKAELTAVCDIKPERLQWAKENLGSGVRTFDNADDLMSSGIVDGVMIAVPHYSHPPLAIKAFAKGLHVLVEKPAGVYTKQVREMNEAAAKSGKVFGIMYNQRTNPLYQKLRELIKSGELGELRRTNWIITNWFRTQAYYNSGGWRATWAGEGGGVLLNQDPHQLDLWQWTCGMPKRVRAFCGFGKYHDIEVEDEVTAYVEYENGATGVFVTTTGEAPGTNRFEIVGDKGKIVIEDGKLNFWRLRQSSSQYIREAKDGFSQPECWKCEVPIHGKETAHAGITANWVDSILNGTPLLAPGYEGINGLQISNAMHLSAWTDNWVDIPVDEELFYSMLQEKIKNSRFVKTVDEKTLDLEGSF